MLLQSASDGSSLLPLYPLFKDDLVHQFISEDLKAAIMGKPKALQNQKKQKVIDETVELPTKQRV